MSPSPQFPAATVPWAGSSWARPQHVPSTHFLSSFVMALRHDDAVTQRAVRLPPLSSRPRGLSGGQLVPPHGCQPPTGCADIGSAACWRPWVAPRPAVKSRLTEFYPPGRWRRAHPYNTLAPCSGRRSRHQVSLILWEALCGTRAACNPGLICQLLRQNLPKGSA